MTTVDGWPFLIARGRRRGYSVLLAPRYLVGDHGFLEEAAAPVRGAPFRVAAVPGRGRLAWAEHVVSTSDIGGDPHDEYGRPLRLLYGFLCRQGKPAVAGEDLEHAREVALSVYRRFLAGEEEFLVEPSEPFAVTGVAVPAMQAPPPAPRRTGRGLIWAGAGIVVAGGVVAAIVGLTSGPEPPPPCPPTTVKPGAAPLPTQTFVCQDGKGAQLTYDPQKWPPRPTSAK
jgi:hypothetical protein